MAPQSSDSITTIFRFVDQPGILERFLIRLRLEKRKYSFFNVKTLIIQTIYLRLVIAPLGESQFNKYYHAVIFNSLLRSKSAQPVSVKNKH